MCIVTSISLFIGSLVAFRTTNMMEILLQKPHFLAYASGFLFPLVCVLCYGLALFMGHMEFVVTYISDSVTDPPISGIFGLLLSLTLALFGILACIRHLYVREVCAAHPEFASPRVHLAHSVSGWLAVIGTFAMVIVAHFQVHTTTVLHSLGALVGIGCGVLYFSLQAIVTKAMVPRYTSFCVLNIRVFLAIFSVILYVVGVSAGFLALAQFDGNHTQLHRWMPNDGGYIAHAVSAVCEWILAVNYALYFYTFSSEFKHVQLKPIQVQLATRIMRISASPKENGILETI